MFIELDVLRKRLSNLAAEYAKSQAAVIAREATHPEVTLETIKFQAGILAGVGQAFMLIDKELVSLGEEKNG